MSSRQLKVITITNQKGGTGKTTLSALLTYGLASRGYNVLMLDLDPQSHLSSLLLKITEIEEVKDGIIQMAQGEKFNIRKIDLGTKGEIGLIPSGLNYIITVFRGQIPSWDPYAIYLRLMREPAITRKYDYVICDTPPELFPPTIWGLYAADYILIPSNYEELSLSGVKLLLREIIPEVMNRSKKEPKVLGVALINAVKKISQKSLDELNTALYNFIKKTLPSLNRSYIYKKPLFSNVIHRYDDLKDLIYRPKRWELPLHRVIDRNPELKSEITAFSDEVLERINNFEGISQ
ncbi:MULTISPECIES: ParA family protein [Thermoprotei]|uniref:ParA family protein n=1 Tax=Thermoprotei TaxID=183924 RepID=UPI003164A047